MLRPLLAALFLAAPVGALAAQDEAPTDDAPAESSAAPASSEDGPRRRRGTTLGLGFESVSDGFGNSLTATVGGLDTHFGMQINDLVGVYVPLHLSFGAFPNQGTVAGIPRGSPAPSRSPWSPTSPSPTGSSSAAAAGWAS